MTNLTVFGGGLWWHLNLGLEKPLSAQRAVVLWELGRQECLKELKTLSGPSVYYFVLIFGGYGQQVLKTEKRP